MSISTKVISNKTETSGCNGQHVRVKRLTDTYFISLDVHNGATVDDLHARTAAVMNVVPIDLRLCRVDANGRVTFLHEETHGDVKLSGPPHSFDGTGRQVVYALLRTPDGWEQPCAIDYPSDVVGANSSKGRGS